MNHEVSYVGPPPKPIYFSMNSSHKFHCLELRKICSCLLKIRGVEDCLKTRMELSYLRENWIFEIHLKNWSLESYLKKIGILEFI